jgi:glycosyltransferase involved in cell wall biosynthesis
VTRRLSPTPLPGDFTDLVVLYAANWWHGIRYQDQHMASRLAKRFPILYVDPPLSRLTPRNFPYLASALDRPRLRLVEPSLARLTVETPPGPFRPGMRKVTDVLVRRSITRAIHELNATVRAAIAGAPGIDLFRACGAKVNIYWAQDDLVGGADLMGTNPDWVLQSELRIAAAADEIIAANPVVADRWSGLGYRPHLVPFGCDPDTFADVDAAPLPPDVDLEGPIVGFVGLLGSRIDFPLIEAIAERGRSLLLVGPRHWEFDIERADKVLARPNVCWVGKKEFDELPSYLRMIDVGIVPYTDSAFNRGSFPLKTLEYLSAGRAVVATDLPAIRWLGTDLITVATTPDAFADAVDAELARARTPQLVARRQDFARGHSWDRRADAFTQIIDEATTN